MKIWSIKFDIVYFFIFCITSLIFYATGEYRNYFYHTESEYGEFTKAICLMAMFITSIFVFIFRIFLLDLGGIFVHTLIIVSCLFRVIFYEEFHYAEYFAKAVFFENTKFCGTSANRVANSSELKVCYGYLRYSWARYIIKDTSGEISKPYSKWSELTKATIESNNISSKIIYCNYRTVQQIRKEYFYVVSACE